MHSCLTPVRRYLPKPVSSQHHGELGHPRGWVEFGTRRFYRTRIRYTRARDGDKLVIPAKGQNLFPFISIAVRKANGDSQMSSRGERADGALEVTETIYPRSYEKSSTRQKLILEAKTVV